MSREDYERMGTELSFALIQDIIARSYNKSPEDLAINTRRREIVEPRQAAMFFGFMQLDMTATQVGASLARRGHTVVLHACKTVKKLYETNRQYRTQLQDISARLGVTELRLRELLARRKQWW